MTNKLIKISFSLAFFIAMTFSTVAQAAPRVSISPLSVTFPESGGQQQLTIRLDEPIIAPALETAFLTLTFTSNDSRIRIVPSTITYLANEWTQSKSINVIVFGSNSIVSNATIHFVTDSNSEYYRGFSGDVPVVFLEDATHGTGSSVGVSTGVMWGCKDPAALNYNEFSASNPKLCKYPISKTITPSTRIVRSKRKSHLRKDSLVLNLKRS